MNLDLSTKAEITWCPGCSNSQILVAFRQAVDEIVKNKELKIEDLVIFSGIGCHGKITDYLNINSFTSLHGRLVPTMTGVKCANPNLKIVGFSGDGDSLDEGIAHLIHAAKRNSDISLFIHDNKIFALTTGQFNALSSKGFKGKSTPEGNIEEPLNPLLIALSSGATFVARTYAGDIQGTKKIMQEAINHKGFAFVDIIQPCITFFDTRDYFKDKIYWLEDNYPRDDFNKALEKITESTQEKVSLGIFYKKDKPTFEEELYK
ncbi:MAG: 2-oxoacid:ferredoxin oxidoreductase subunit beta [Candidatus Zambryskibacteria bacterium]|nr:2-oxoacid:ferredoxin oxidoreductase subunit beta [Candidatus Zambryskibacteria bacterium]